MSDIRSIEADDVARVRLPAGGSESSNDISAAMQSSSQDAECMTPECAICLQPCIHPVRLPCSHMFCFLCMKGVAGHSRRCALCRAEIPEQFIRRPTLVSSENCVSCVNKETSADGFKYRWYYEGVGGWWEYDERTSQELEMRREERETNKVDKSSTFEILIAGFIYIIDLEQGIQYRRGHPRRRRKIKRDVAGIPDYKGVAGLKYRKKPTSLTQERRGGDGDEAANSTSANQSAGAVVINATRLTSLESVSNDRRLNSSSVADRRDNSINGTVRQMESLAVDELRQRRRPDEQPRSLPDERSRHGNSSRHERHSRRLAVEHDSDIDN